MRKVDSIIQILQEELVIRKKSYFALSQATKILREKGILSEFDISNGYLKEKLEKGEIPQAMKTTGKPSLWRIHKDKSYKKNNPADNKNIVLKKQKEKVKIRLHINTKRTHRNDNDQVYLICPSCGANVFVPVEYRHENSLCCYNCKRWFINTISNNTQNHDNSKSQQDIISNNDNIIIDKTTTLTKQQKNWFIGIVIFIMIVILMIGNYKSKVPYSDNKPVIVKEEKKRSPEIIYTDIKKALADEFPGTCKILFNEMQTDYPNSILFDSVKIIYDSAMNIVQLKKEEARKKRKIYEAKKKKETKQVKQSKYLKVFAQAYSDGILSCNVYLTDKSGNIHYLNANSISYSIYDFNNNRIKPIGNISKSNTSDGLFIDIPLGTNVFKAKSISFIISTSQGITYKSNNVSIDY